jgi:hypothetical protein
MVTLSNPARRTTTTWATEGHFSRMGSRLALSGLNLPARTVASAVITTLALEPWMRLRTPPSAYPEKMAV